MLRGNALHRIGSEPAGIDPRSHVGELDRQHHISVRLLVDRYTLSGAPTHILTNQCTNGSKKINSRSMLFSRILSEASDEVRRAASEIVNDPRGEARKLEIIIERSQEALKRAEKMVRESRRGRSKSQRKRARREIPGNGR
jgi:hypothetical protein